MSDAAVMTRSAVSADGSRIGWAERGAGPALVLVHGATADRSRWAAVESALAAHYRLFLVDRRGRGLSTAEAAGPYELAREADDIRAVIAAAAAGQGGAPVGLFGHSYGALCALDAAAGNPQVARVQVYDPAFATPGAEVIGPEALALLERLIDAGEHDAALQHFFTAIIGVPAAAVAQLRAQTGPLAIWPQRLALVPTLPREGRAANAWRPSPALATLGARLEVLVGSDSPAWLQAAAEALHSAVPGSTRVCLDGQAHAAMDTAPALFVAALRRYLSA